MKQTDFSNTYKKLRNRHIELTAKAEQISALDGSTRNLLKNIRKKVQENQFVIALAGEFQSGKSTTFNAVCDGRQLSPMGAGVKTSGAILSVQPLSDRNAKEEAVIQWRTGAELTAGFSDLLLPRLRSLRPERFQKYTAAELPDIIDLDRSSDLRQVQEAAEKEWAAWNKDRAGYDPDHKGLLDIIRSAMIIARFHQNRTLQEYRRQSAFPLHKAAGMAAFPMNWESRWSSGHAENFSLEESLFVFIREVRLKIHSPALSRLGCVLVDCPGLFASRWDTMRAREAMFDADAVLYVFDGSKTLKLSDLNALQFIRKNGMAHKLFFGCNMRGHTLADSRRILAASLTSLHQSGFDIPREDAALFHALLAFHAQRLQRFMNRDDQTDADEKNRRIKSVFQQMVLLDAGTEIPSLSENTVMVKEARAAAGLDALMGMAEHRVLSRKARAILIDNGAAAAVQCLSEAEGALKNREINAFKKEQEFRRQAAEIETGLRKFKGDCAGIIRRMDDNRPDKALAEDVWSRLAASEEGLTERISERIYHEAVKGFSFSLLKKEVFQERISQIIKSEFDDCFTEIISTWSAEIKEGRNFIYNKEMVQRIQDVSRRLKQVWEASDPADTDMLSGIAIKEFSGNLEMDAASLLQETGREADLENVRYNALLAAGGITGIFTAASGVLMAAYLLITRLFWVRIVTVAALAVNILLVVLTKGLVEKSLRDDIKKKLGPAIGMLFHDIQKDAKEGFQQFSKEIRIRYKQTFEAAADKPRALFDARKKQIETDFQQGRKERTAAGLEARRIRKEEIAPLRRSFEQFISEAEAVLQQAESQNTRR